MHRQICAFVVRIWHKQVFFWRVSYYLVCNRNPGRNHIYSLFWPYMVPKCHYHWTFSNNFNRFIALYWSGISMSAAKAMAASGFLALVTVLWKLTNWKLSNFLAGISSSNSSIRSQGPSPTPIRTIDRGYLEAWTMELTVTSSSVTWPSATITRIWYCNKRKLSFNRHNYHKNLIWVYTIRKFKIKMVKERGYLEACTIEWTVASSSVIWPSATITRILELKGGRHDCILSWVGVCGPWRCFHSIHSFRTESIK